MLNRFRKLKWQIDADSQAGPYRAHNEDNLVWRADAERCFAIVCDGVGGHNAGEIASLRTCNLLADALSSLDKAEEATLQTILRQTHLALCDAADADPALRHMATTVVLSLQCGPWAWIAWVGDSRAYWQSGSALEQVTQDHSFVAEKVAQGILTLEEARAHPMASTITSSLGGTRNGLRHLGVKKLRLRRGDRLILMTDGVYCALPNEVLALTAREGAQALTARAIENGSRDNASAIVIATE